MAAKISMQGVSRSFPVRGGTFHALRDINLDVADGEFLCVVGPSGCGKSTLLRMLGDLDLPSRGRVAIDHADPARPLTAMIFQQESVFPWLTVEQNAAYGLKVTDTWSAGSPARIDYFLETHRPHARSAASIRTSFPAA